jgi:hypothetical protein
MTSVGMIWMLLSCAFAIATITAVMNTLSGVMFEIIKLLSVPLAISTGSHSSLNHLARLWLIVPPILTSPLKPSWRRKAYMAEA